MRTSSKWRGRCARARTPRKASAHSSKSASRSGAQSDAVSIAAGRRPESKPGRRRVIRVLRSVAGERLAQCRDVLHELARQVQRSRHVRIGIEASIDMRMKRQSAALMDFVIERQRAEDPDDAKERARERAEVVG